MALKRVVEFALEALPDRVAVGLDDHAALDDLGRLGHIALDDHVLIPGGEVFFSRSNRGICHEFDLPLVSLLYCTIAAMSPSIVCGSASASTSKPQSRTVCEVTGPIEATFIPRRVPGSRGLLHIPDGGGTSENDPVRFPIEGFGELLH